MQQYKLNILNRENTGRGVARRLRAEGNIPASVYSKGKARSISLSAVEFRDLNRAIGGGAALIELIDEKGETALTHVQEIQRNAVKRCINHIDFHEVARGETFVAHVPIHLIHEADALGVKNEGGVIDHKTHNVEIRCRPSKLPGHIEVDVSGLSVGDAIHIADLPVVEGVEYLGTPIQVVVSCQSPTVAPASDDEAGAAVAADEVPASKVKNDADGE
jgi:large subunit ribosomal protein L25